MFFQRKMITSGILMMSFFCFTNGFFWGSSSEPEPTPKPLIYAYPFPSIYHQRYIQAQQLQQQGPVQQLIQNIPQEIPQEVHNQAIPAIPIQVPLSAQFSPVENLHNVQLVPCLCPVSPNVEYEKVQEQPSSRIL